ncbi:DMT family transporter [Microvirga sp. M2]|uniref:DMT family transporter n=1 Tax=Microvirga sp. M2 TaxID=3073270 RepID=UPI0039C40E36
MAWVYLTLAGLFETGWAIGLKYSEGFTPLAPSAPTAVSMPASVLLLGIALKTLPVETGYAAWTGIDTVGTAIRPGSIGLIVLGILGLKFAAP